MRRFIPLLILPYMSYAHEPIFGLGPGTIFKGGVGIEFEYEKVKGEEGLATEVLYGITEDLSFTARSVNDNGNIKEAGLRLKYRIWKRYDVGLIDALSLIGGTIFDVEENRVYPLGGLAVGRESRRWYFFADMRASRKLFIDGAVGIRPWLMEYLKPDLVLLSELNYEQKGDVRVLFTSPVFFFTYRNIALKGGVQIPTYKSEEAKRRGVKGKVSLSFEVHF